MTNKNNPNVKIVTGKVNRINIGFTKKFKSPSTMATVNAVVNSSTTTPFIKYDSAITREAVISILRSNFISLGFSCIKIVAFVKNVPFPQKIILVRYEAILKIKELFLTKDYKYNYFFLLIL